MVYIELASGETRLFGDREKVWFLEWTGRGWELARCPAKKVCSDLWISSGEDDGWHYVKRQHVRQPAD